MFCRPSCRWEAFKARGERRQRGDEDRDGRYPAACSSDASAENGTGCSRRAALGAHPPPPIDGTAAAVGGQLFVRSDGPISAAFAATPGDQNRAPPNRGFKGDRSDGRAEPALQRNREANRSVRHRGQVSGKAERAPYHVRTQRNRPVDDTSRITAAPRAATNDPGLNTGRRRQSTTIRLDASTRWKGQRQIAFTTCAPGRRRPVYRCCWMMPPSRRSVQPIANHRNPARAGFRKSIHAAIALQR